VWALRSLGHEASRVYGPDLMAKYCERSAKTGVRMYLYGGRNQGALVELALRLRRRYPGLQIVGGYSPPFRALDEDEQQWVVDDINRSKADVVWVGIGQPKQEIWMREYRDRLDAPMLVGVGAAFDFHAGLVPQAPAWMQNVGLEWVYRLSKEPRRLWRRYARYNPRFVAGFVRQKLTIRAR
jgi:N-acetylglucosaminyldiphosphoundecaprenol N-acetyl-beta-D-mannosaminyltransferase